MDKTPINMGLDELGYVTYLIAVILNSRGMLDCINLDIEWETKVLPLALKFLDEEWYTSEYHSLIEALDDFLEIAEGYNYYRQEEE